MSSEYISKSEILHLIHLIGDVSGTLFLQGLSVNCHLNKLHQVLTKVDDYIITLRDRFDVIYFDDEDLGQTSRTFEVVHYVL